MIEQKETVLDNYERPSSIKDWMAPHYPPQMKIQVIKSQTDIEVAKAQALTRDR
jgi:hypothetical protein